MTASRFAAVRAAALAKLGAVLFASVLLTACVTTRTPLPAATGDSRDRITASDESDGLTGCSDSSPP